MKYLFVGLVIYCSLADSAVAQVNIDSLENKLQSTSNSDRLLVLTDLTRAFERRDPAQSVTYAREATSLLDEFPNDDIALDLLYLKGRAHLWLGQYDSAFVYAGETDALARQADREKGLAEAANLRGTTYSLQGQFDEALPHFLDALSHWEHISDERGIGNTLNNLGIVMMRTGRYDESLAYYMRSLTTWENLGDQGGLARALNNTGNIHVDLENYDEALTFYQRSLDIRAQLGDSVGVASLLNNIGLIEVKTGSLDAALDYYLRALAIWDGVGDRNNVGRVLSNAATAYLAQGNLVKAQESGERALAIKKEIGDKRGTGISLNTLGQIHKASAQGDKALERFKEALSYAGESNDLKLTRDIYAGLTDTHEMMGNFAQALSAHRQFKVVHDSLFNADSQSIIAELQTQYQTKEQLREIEALQKQQEIQSLWRKALIAGLLLVVFIAFLIYSRYLLKNRAHIALEKAHADLHATQTQLIHTEKMASLGQLTSGIAHEIKNPLNFVNNFADMSLDLATELGEKMETTPDIRLADVQEELIDLKVNAEKINLHGKRMDSIVRNMMLHANQNQNERYDIEINDFVDEFVNVHRSSGNNGHDPGGHQRWSGEAFGG